MNLQGRNLQQGLTGDDVRLLQTELALLQPPVIIPDSERQPALFGPATLSAIQNFQKAHALPTTGIVDPITAKAINDAVNALFPPVVQVAAAVLSLGTQGDDVARVQDALAKLGRTLPPDEAARRVLGAGTSAVIKALQQEFGLLATGAVDASTLALINSKLGQLATAPRVIRGKVLDADGNPAKGLTVSAFNHGPDGEALAGKPVNTALDGSYALAYTPPPGGRSDLRLQVSTTVIGVAGPVTVVFETTPSAASLLTNAGPLEVIDFRLSGPANVPKTEYEQMLSDVTPLIGSRPLTSLVENATQHDVSLLALQSGYTTDQVTALVASHQLSKDAGVPAPVLYGLFRGGLQPNLAALQATHAQVRLKALQASIRQGLAPKTIDGKNVEDLLAGLAPVSLAPLQGLLGGTVNASEFAALAAIYSKNSQDPAAFWKQVAADPVLGSRAPKLQFTVQLAALVNNHQPLVAAVSALPGMTQASALVSLTEANWKALIQTQGVGVPPDSPGATPEEQTNNYVQQIVVQAEAAYPTAFFAERLPDSQVKTFLKAQPSFDLISTYSPQFFKHNPDAAKTLTPQDRGQLASYQRLRRLGNAKEALAMLPHVSSAHQISRIDRQTFAERLKDDLPSTRADEIYDQALRTSAIATALRAEHGAAHNRTSMRVLPRLDALKQATLAADSIPDWQTLFGTFDFCACEECASAHGPAAYFVDILSFLGDRAGAAGKSVRDALFARRPDLGDIELSCENANTPVPLIDLVNEILENAVSPPAPFVPATLPAALESDLSLATATDVLRAAFSPPLQAGARVEVLEAGTRWRVWDEPFAYWVTKSNNALNIASRSRQTTGSAAERRAIPQYRNSAAYAELGKSVFPWNLPFELPIEEARAFLGQLGVSRPSLIEALRPLPSPFVPNSAVAIGLASERLSITDTERKIIVGEALTPPRLPADFWGAAPVAVLSTVEALLEASGLSYAELDLLIGTWFINPTGVLSISAKSGAPVDTCDTTNLTINGLNAGVLDRIHRFVRLWRAVGWTIPETDRVVHALAPNPNAPELTNEMLVRVEHLSSICSSLRIPVVPALALWKSIDTQEPASLYLSLFYNPAAFKPQDDAFRLRPDSKELADSGKRLSDFAATLQAAFRMNAAGVTLLVAKTDGHLNLANLSLLYRHSVLARQLGLPVQDLLTTIELTGLNPFDSSQSQEAIQFIEVVTAIQGAGFSVPQLDYLLRQRFNPPAPFVPLDSALAVTLTELRAALLTNDSAPDIIEDRIAAALSLPGDVAASLLGRVSHSGKMALQQFIDLAAIALTPAAPALTRDNARPQYEMLEKLLKIASIMQTLGLPGSQLDWLFRENTWLATAPDPPSQPVPLANWYSLIQLEQLQDDLDLEAGAVEAILSALGVSSKQALIDTLSKWLAWPPDDLATLIGNPAQTTDSGLLNVHFPQDSRLDLIVRIGRAMKLSKALGVSVAAANQWCDATVTDANAKAIRNATKAKYDDDAWIKIVTPQQNALRDKQRAALVSYLAARPSLWNPQLAQADANDLFDHFLIDVEMSSCQLTSRIKQAIGSVQLFTQRCLMGLEPGITTADPKWTQWGWMKNFRVWEANRKIWLYPENWIEPELRDNKTPFFEDLENELLQSNLDNDAAEQALSHYLQKLDDVSRLEIVGMYEDEDQNLHVFGRTFHIPHNYYYRCRVGSTLSWAPWGKVDLDIEGDHLIPVMWNRKLMLIWPIFTDKQLQKPVNMPQPGGTVDSADHYWAIQLAWSEYQHGRWSGKNLSDAVTFLAYNHEDNVLFGPLVSGLTVLARAKDGVTVSTGNDGGGNGGGSTPQPPQLPPAGSTNEPRQLVPKELIAFKALVSGDTLAVRGYLRRDYRAAPQSGDQAIAYPFGEFHFSGCRKIVTSVPDGQMLRRNFALAPSGTKHDCMWFTGTSSGVTLFDGTFPALPLFILPTVLSLGNMPASLAGDPSSTLVHKIDIPVLDQATAFRLLVPHQDLQFVGDRPFFFEDAQRAFVVTSTGTSGTRNRPNINWVIGNLATAERADFFLSPAPQPPAPQPAGSFTVLVPGEAGQRIARELPPVIVQPEFSARTLLPSFWTTREYTFTNFHHPYVCDFGKALNRNGIAALFSVSVQELTDAASFDAYQPEQRVLQPYPIDEVEFQSGRAYEVYNWELFFHIPLLIATRLSGNQRFEEAQRWFHYIFDPTASSGDAVPQKYWHTRPFYERVQGDYETESVGAIEAMAANGPSNDLKAAIEQWRSNPFSPDAVARLRTTAYQKTVVMKYIDNLIAWADQLFRANTLESINEATQFYVLAAEILGRRPEVIQRNLRPAVQTFNTLLPVGPLGNAMEQIELLIPAAGGSASLGDAQAPDPPSDTVLYFCVPENDRLLGYWSTVADRLFKIRHCMNIEGQVQQLPLFEPPIDPALLVRARAAGLSLGDVLSDVAGATLPNYRFSVMLQKANEVAAEVRNLGAELLSVLEKRDAETLSTLRSGQELLLLQSVRDVRARQVDEAAANIAALEKSRDMAQARKDYYESRDFISLLETTAAGLSTAAQVMQLLKTGSDAISIPLSLLPDAKAGSPTTIGITIGGSNISQSNRAHGDLLGTISESLSIGASLATRFAEYDRRQDEWNHQANLATIELKQIDQQLAAAQIRFDMANRELANHDQQVEDARDLDQFLRTKYTNQDLFQWMIGQVSGVYFQSYQLAYDLAKRAEMCLQHELGLAYGQTSFIQFGYWDSLRKGLLAGDRLGYDLKRLELAYIDGNRREYELTKHISLLSLAPHQLLALKETGAGQFDIPEWLFDLDTPGHYMRRIRTVSVTIPCVTGPYTTIHSKLTLLKSSYRRSTDLSQGYAPVVGSAGDGSTTADPRFIVDRKISDAIVTSTGQYDAGLFDPAMRDERFLPFEGAGTDTTWTLELPNSFKTFDYSTISDVILHVRYTARDGGDPLKAAATASAVAIVKTGQPLQRFFSLRHEFPTEWQRLVSSSITPASMVVDLAATRFPYFAQGRTITIQQAQVLVRSTAAVPPSATIAPGKNPQDLSKTTWTDAAGPGPWTIAASSDPGSINEIYVIMTFTLS